MCRVHSTNFIFGETSPLSPMKKNPHNLEGTKMTVPNVRGRHRFHHSRSEFLRLFTVVPLVGTSAWCIWRYFLDLLWDDFHCFTLRNGSNCGHRSGDDFGDQQGSKKTWFFGPYCECASASFWRCWCWPRSQRPYGLYILHPMIVALVSAILLMQKSWGHKTHWQSQNLRGRQCAPWVSWLCFIKTRRLEGGDWTCDKTDQTAHAYGSLIKCNIVLTLRRGTDGVFAHKDGAFAGKACALFFLLFRWALWSFGWSMAQRQQNPKGGTAMSVAMRHWFMLWRYWSHKGVSVVAFFSRCAWTMVVAWNAHHGVLLRWMILVIQCIPIPQNHFEPHNKVHRWYEQRCALAVTKVWNSLQNHQSAYEAGEARKAGSAHMPRAIYHQGHDLGNTYSKSLECNDV